MTAIPAKQRNGDGVNLMKLNRNEIAKYLNECFKPYGEAYEPFVDEHGIIEHTTSILIKSTLNGQPAMSDGNFCGIQFPSPEMLKQLPEFNAAKWHTLYESFNDVFDALPKPWRAIHPLFYDEMNTIIFSNAATVQRRYFDLFWVKYRDNQLEFQQPENNLRAPIIISAGGETVGMLAPNGWDQHEKDFRTCIRAHIRKWGN